MTESPITKPQAYLVDEDFIRRVAALVIRRLRSMPATGETPPAVEAERIVCEETILNRPVGTTLLIRRDALVTPLAKDTAKDRRITIVRQSTSSDRRNRHHENRTHDRHRHAVPISAGDEVVHASLRGDRPICRRHRQ